MANSSHGNGKDNGHGHGHANGHGSGHGGHHELTVSTALKVGAILLFLTAVTVWTAQIDLGKWNVPLAMAIATTKAFLVVGFFMNLFYDRRENAGIFATSFVFLFIFFGLTAPDIFTRTQFNVTKAELAAKQAELASKGGPLFKKAWVETPEILAKGKELFAQNCVSCHGDAGKGDGIAAGGLNPKPRNFTLGDGWKNGRKPSGIFKTLKEGIPGSGMGSYQGLPADQRWAISHYVRSLGPQPAPADSNEDLAKVGVDPNKEDSGDAAPKGIPVKLAMKRMAESGFQGVTRAYADTTADRAGGEGLYRAYCLQCHGSQGQGAVVRGQGAWPKNVIATGPLASAQLGLEQFTRVVTQGLPGNLMPGQGNLTSAQIRELHAYVQKLR